MHDRAGPLLERDGELAAIDAALRPRRRGGALLYLEAPAGLGKSRLLTAATERGEAAGLRVLTARAAELEQGVPFGLARSLLGAHVPTDETVQGMCAATARLAARETLLIAVDDLHWSDAASLRFLVGLAERLADLHLVLVLAARPGVPGSRARLAARLAGHPLAHTLQPAPLAAEAVARMAATRCQGPADPAFVVACADATGGNPFLLTKLLDALTAAGVPADAAGAACAAELLPEAVLRSVVVRLGRLTPAAQELAAAVAVLGDGTLLRRGAALANLEVEAAEGAADTLVSAAILRPGEALTMGAPLIGAAVLGATRCFALSRARRRAAVLLHADGASPEDVAVQLLGARARADAWVVDLLREAARRALDRGDPIAAVTLLRRALDEPPPGDSRADVLCELARAQTAAGDPGAVHSVERSLALTDDPTRRARALHALSHVLFVRGEFAAATAAADQGLAELADDDPLADELFAAALAAGCSHPSTHEHALARLEPFLAGLREGRVPRHPVLIALLASTNTAAGASRVDVRGLADAALAADPDAMVFGLAARALLAVDELEPLRKAADQALASARRRGSPIGSAVATQWRAAALFRAGDLAGAVRDGEAACEITRKGWAGTGGWNTYYLARAYCERGELGHAERVLADATVGKDDPRGAAAVLEAEGVLATQRNRPKDALAAFLASGAVVEGTSRAFPPTSGWRTHAALAAHALGDSARARAWLGEEIERVGDAFAPGVRASPLLAAGRVVGGDEGIALLGRALDLLEQSPAALERAHAHVELGGALRRAGRRVDARAHLCSGLRLAVDCGAAPLAERARSELSASGGRLRKLSPRGPEGLTPSEERIARLALQRLSVPEIARKLVLSAKTVEWHLGNIYRKLGVHSRTELYDRWSIRLGEPTDRSR